MDGGGEVTFGHSFGEVLATCRYMMGYGEGE